MPFSLRREGTALPCRVSSPRSGMGELSGCFIGPRRQISSSCRLALVKAKGDGRLSDVSQMEGGLRRRRSLRRPGRDFSPRSGRLLCLPLSRDRRPSRGALHGHRRRASARGDHRQCAGNGGLETPDRARQTLEGRLLRLDALYMAWQGARIARVSGLCGVWRGGRAPPPWDSTPDPIAVYEMTPFPSRRASVRTAK